MSDSRTTPPVKSKVITLRVSEDEYFRYTRAADWMGLSLSNFLRSSLDRAEQTQLETPRVRKKRTAPARDINPDLLYAIHRIGSNMNQIAKALNVANLTGDEVSAKDLLLLLFSIEEQLEQIIKQNDLASDEIVQNLKNEILALLPPEKKKEGERAQ